MTLEAIEKARLAAIEFTHRADELSLLIRTPNKWGNVNDTSIYPKESGALRRQSMELTRALADLRRS